MNERVLNVPVAFVWVLFAGLCLGCLVLAWLNVRGAHGPRERRFALRVSLLTLGLAAALVGAIALIPTPYVYLAAAGFLVLVPASVYRWAVQHQLIRKLEEGRGEKGDGDAHPGQPRG